MKIMVTGGSGFIGRYVCENLKRKGHQVLIYDIEGPKFDGCIFARGHIEDKVKLTALIKNSDAVIHLAGVLGTSETIDEPVRPAFINITGSLYVFEAIRKYDKRCCYIAVGNHFMLNTYAITKTAAERFALMYNKEHHTRIAVVRGLNAYGPYQKDKPVRKVIPNFIIPALKNEPLIIYGSGEQVMDFIHAADLAEILCRALLNDHNIYDHVIEAGSGRNTTINYIAETIMRLTGSNSQIEHTPMRRGEIENSTVIADTSTLSALDYRPSEMMPLIEGLKETIRYYSENLEIYN
jgi:UDP-glucose 4-epimerase